MNLDAYNDRGLGQWEDHWLDPDDDELEPVYTGYDDWEGEPWQE